MSKVKVGIIGATGYVGVELIRLLKFRWLVSDLGDACRKVSHFYFKIDINLFLAIEMSYMAMDQVL